MRERHSTNWGGAFDFAQDLHAQGALEDADAIYTYVVQLFPDELWPAYHWALSAYLNGHHAMAERRAYRLLDRFPSEAPRIRDLLGDIAMDQRDFDIAMKSFAVALDANPESRDLIHKHAFASMCWNLFGSFGFDYPRTDYGVLVISLDTASPHFCRLRANLNEMGIEPQHVQGVWGKHLPYALLDEIAHAHEPHERGTLGCLLAHVNAWEAALESDHEVCLIMEDDALPIGVLPSSFRSLSLPANFDVCFANERACFKGSSRDFYEAKGFVAKDVLESLATWPLDHSAPGADGYFVSRKGAKRLLELFKQGLSRGDVDWWLVRHCVDRENYRFLPPDSTTAAVLGNVEGIEAPAITAYSLFPHIVKTAPLYSIRNENNDA
ncbi:hypothetical protein AcidC75_34260 [Acidisoma sp. C75]